MTGGTLTCSNCSGQGPDVFWTGAMLACGRCDPTLQEEQGAVFPLLTGDDLLSMPDPEFLVEGLIPESGLSVLFGATSTFKSFLALDWGLSVAAGAPWLGHGVKRKWVVYIAAEGRGGLKQRYRAWLAARGMQGVEQIRFLPEAVSLLDDEQVGRVKRSLATLPERCGLLVVDTVARTMPGGDENSARDVGSFVQAVDGLREADAALVVHHTGKTRDDERGSSALRGAADLSMKLARDEGSRRLSLSCAKAKDFAEWPLLDLRVEESAGSLVLSKVVEAAGARDDLTDRVLAFVVEHGPASKRSVREGVTARGERVDEALRVLEVAGSIESTPKGYKACPGPPDTPGHASLAASGGGVSREGETPVGGPLRDTPHAVSVSAGVSHLDDRRVDHLAEAFNAVELSEEAWASFAASHDVETLDLT